MLNQNKKALTVVAHGKFSHVRDLQVSINSTHIDFKSIQVASFLKRRGINTTVFDCQWQGVSELVSFLKDKNASYLVLQKDTFNSLPSGTLTKLKNDHKIEILLDGSNTQIKDPNKYLRNGVDVLIESGFYFTINDVINTLSIPFNPFLDHINGIKYINGKDEITQTNYRELGAELTYVSPDRDFLNLEEYQKAIKKYEQEYYFTLKTSFLDGRVVTPQVMREEVLKVANKYTTHFFEIVDEHQHINEKWLTEFNALLQGDDIDYSVVYSLHYSIVDEALVRFFEEKENTIISIKGDNEAINITTNEARRKWLIPILKSSKLINKKGILNKFEFPIAYQGDTFKEVKSILNLLSENVPDNLRILNISDSNNNYWTLVITYINLVITYHQSLQKGEKVNAFKYKTKKMKLATKLFFKKPER